MDTPVEPPKKKLSKKLPILIGVVIANLAIVLLLSRGGLTRAGDERPLDVTITPNSSSSVNINWSTGLATQGQILYSNNMDAVLSCKAVNNGGKATPDYAPEETQTTDHAKTIEGLSAGTTYYFRIQIGSNCYDNAGVPWSFSTPSSDGAPPASVAPTRATVSLPPGALSVTPIQRLQIPNNLPQTTPVTSCTYTDCATIKSKFGQGCSTQDYLLCLRKNVTPTKATQ